jgi:hypothetical protein
VQRDFGTVLRWWRYDRSQRISVIMAVVPAFFRVICKFAIISFLSSGSVVLAADKGVNESCFLALHFAEGNALSIQFSNGESTRRDVTIERYSADGRLLDKVAKTLPAFGKEEARLDLSSPIPEFGWVRVLTKGSAVTMQTALEMTRQGTVETILEPPAHRHPEPNKRLSASPHKWTFDLIDKQSVLEYFVNLSEYPVQVAMCQDDVPDCTSPTLPNTVAPLASIAFPLDHSRRYGVLESTPGYSAVVLLSPTEGTKQYFDAASCIKFDGSTSCAAMPLSAGKTSAPKFVSPMAQKVIENSEAAKSSPAALAPKPGDASSPEVLAERIKKGTASRCAIASVPPGAEIYIDGLKMGIAPIVFVLLKRDDAPRIIEIRMTGYRVVEKRLVPDGKPIILGVDLEKQ